MEAATGGRGRIEAAIGGKGRIGAAAFAGEPSLLLLLATEMLNERLPVADEMPTAAAVDGPASAEADELAALDVAFAGVRQSGADEWEIGG